MQKRGGKEKPKMKKKVYGFIVLKGGRKKKKPPIFFGPWGQRPEKIEKGWGFFFWFWGLFLVAFF